MTSETFKGVPLSEIYCDRDAFDLDHLPPVANKRDHIVLYKLPITVNSTRPPEPYKGEIKWDANHVRMPYAPQSEHKSESTSDPNKTVSIPRWDIIQKALLRDFHSSKELEQAIKSYNPKYAREWKFKSLHALFEEVDETEAEAFFNDVLPSIIGLALQLPDIMPCAIPLLKSGQNKSISMSQLQIASLLANAFLCTFPRRNDNKQTSEYASYPSINFSSLYRTAGDQNVEKLRCICSYFRRVCTKMPTGVVTFTRRSIPESNLPDWSKCTMTFDATPLHVSDDGTIEDDGEGLLQVDFANKFLGGGVLNYGCVQEEIRFVICPELLVSRLFTECLEDNECMIIMGCERFNAYRGYASSFMFTGDIADETPRDSSRRRKCTIVAIDAIPFSKRSEQYKASMLKRELNKAYVGFVHDMDTPAPGVATGNWGCGAFGGDKLLKSLLQLMACCVTQRPLVYYTFGDSHLRDDLSAIHEYLAKNKVTVGEVWACLRRFDDSTHLYNFIMACNMQLREHKSQVKDEPSTQAKRSEVEASRKPKRIEPAKESPKRQSPIEDQIEDSDDDSQYSTDEVLELLKKTTAHPIVSPTYKSPVKKAPIPSSNGGRTIRNFFPVVSKSSDSSTSESQEKRPSSSLLTSLDNDFNRKCPKIEQTSTETAIQKCDTDSGTSDQTNPSQEAEHCVKIEETSRVKKASKSKLGNPFAAHEYEDTAMDHDGDEIESQKPDSDCNVSDTTMSKEKLNESEDLFDECLESPKSQALNDDEPNTNKSLTPSKINVRPRGQFKYQERRSIDQSSPSSSTVHSTPSSEDILTASGGELTSSNNDQEENSDLNTESNQLKALNVTSDK